MARSIALALVLLVLVPLGVARAEEGEGFERNVKHIKAQIAELQGAARHAKAEGQVERARELKHRAQELMAELTHLIALRKASEREGKIRGKTPAKSKAKRKKVRAQPKRDAKAQRAIQALSRAIDVLKARDADEELIHALAEAIEEIKHQRHAPKREQPHGEGGGERRMVERWLEVMGLAKRTLVGADRHDAAHRLEHGMHALELALEGRRDDEAMRIRREAPSRAAQAQALFQAAEILQDQRKRREAGWVHELGEHFRQSRPRGEGHEREHGHEDDDDHEHAHDDDDHDEHGHEHDDDDGHEHREEEAAERRALKQRVATIRMAVPVLRDAKRSRLVAILERAILTGDLLLQGRNDEEAQKAFRRTPSLGELTEVLLVAAAHCRETDKHDRAARIAKLARYYAERARDQLREREHGEREAHEREAHEREAHEREMHEREAHEREMHERKRHEREMHERREREGRGGDELEELRREMQALRAHLERLQKHLQELGRRK